MEVNIKSINKENYIKKVINDSYEYYLLQENVKKMVFRKNIVIALISIRKIYFVKDISSDLINDVVPILALVNSEIFKDNKDVVLSALKQDGDNVTICF